MGWDTSATFNYGEPEKVRQANAFARVPLRQHREGLGSLGCAGDAGVARMGS